MFSGLIQILATWLPGFLDDLKSGFRNPLALEILLPIPVYQPLPIPSRYLFCFGK